MENLMVDIQKRSVWTMKQSLKLIDHFLAGVTEQEAKTYRDSGDGWTILEALCHLRDFDVVFYNRARLMLAVDSPDLPAFDHDRMVIEGNYNAQNLDTVLKSLKNSRAKDVRFFKNLTPEQWERVGNHPERERFTMTDSVQQFGLHDLDHLEQMMRILREKK